MVSSADQSTSQPTNQSIHRANQSNNKPINQSTNQSIHHSINKRLTNVNGRRSPQFVRKCKDRLDIHITEKVAMTRIARTSRSMTFEDVNFCASMDPYRWAGRLLQPSLKGSLRFRRREIEKLAFARTPAITRGLYNVGQSGT